MDGIIAQNQDCLRQGLSLLSAITPEVYRNRTKAVYGASVGDHLRHVIEFYTALVGGLETGCVDYDCRERDESTATEPAVARDRLNDLLGDLKAFTRHADRPLWVALSLGEDKPAKTSLARELDFLLSHTVHHFAMISMLLRHAGIVLPPSFGVAPSTLRHRTETEDACAR